MVGAAAARAVQLVQAATAAGGAASATTVPSILLLDRGKQPRFDTKDNMQKLRTVAITPMSSRILYNLGVWDELVNKHPYHRMAIRHETQWSSGLPKFPTKDEEGNDIPSSSWTDILPNPATWFYPGARNEGGLRSTSPVLEFKDLDTPMGYICANDEIQAALVSVLQRGSTTGVAGKSSGSDTGAEQLLPLVPPVRTAFETVLGAVVKPGGKSVSLLRGTVHRVGSEAEGAGDAFTSHLILGCEGGAGPGLNSVVASPTVEHDYAQNAFVCSVELEQLDGGNYSAFQNFFHDGRIVGFLPSGPTTANIVYSTTKAEAMRLVKNKSESEVVEVMNRILYEIAPRDIPKVVGVVKRFADGAGSSQGSGQAPQLCIGTFPLKLKLATTPFSGRSLLLGDAAHAIHPLAGQGLNLGLYDVATMADQLRDAKVHGEDIGSQVVLQRCAMKMFQHTAPLIAAVESIKMTTSSVPTLSCLGMNVLNVLPLIKEHGLQYAASGQYLHNPNSLIFK